jgi:Uma2 family endonuclease
MTAEEMLYAEVPGKATELIRGRLVVREPPGTEHGRVSANLCYAVADFVRRTKLGVVCAQDTGFKIHSDPDTVRAPDLAFIAASRRSAVEPRGYAAIAPDLVAEVVSAGDRRGELLAKVGDWIDAGTRLVWVIDLERREAHVHRPDGGVEVVRANDTLDGEDVLPGFRCLLADVLD